MTDPKYEAFTALDPPDLKRCVVAVAQVSTPNGFTGRTIMTRPASRASFTTNGISPRLCGWLHIRAPDDRSPL